MNPHDVFDDQRPEALSILSTHEPDPKRAARVRARCHDALRQHGPRTRIAPGTPGVGWRRVMEPVMVGSLCAVHLFEVLSRARELYRF